MPRASRQQSDLHQRLARLGAQSRLEELRREESAIRAAFPELFGRRRGRPPAGADAGGARNGRRRRVMSAAQRKAVSERMRRYWAERRRKTAKG